MKAIVSAFFMMSGILGASGVAVADTPSEIVKENLTIDCDVVILTQVPYLQKVHFVVGPADQGLVQIHVPVALGSKETYDYNIVAYNQMDANSCEIGLIDVDLVYVRPFCNPPTLPGDPQVVCNDDPNHIEGYDEKLALDGGTLSLFKKNSTVQVSCTGVFK
jgi:hypothetical protein